MDLVTCTSPFLSARVKFFKGLRALFASNAFFISSFCVLFAAIYKHFFCATTSLIPILCVALNEKIKEKEEHAIKRQVHLLPRQ